MPTRKRSRTRSRSLQLWIGLQVESFRLSDASFSPVSCFVLSHLGLRLFLDWRLHLARISVAPDLKVTRVMWKVLLSEMWKRVKQASWKALEALAQPTSWGLRGLGEWSECCQHCGSGCDLFSEARTLAKNAQNPARACQAASMPSRC